MAAILKQLLLFIAVREPWPRICTKLLLKRITSEWEVLVQSFSQTLHNINTINKFVSNTKSTRNNLFPIKWAYLYDT